MAGLRWNVLRRWIKIARDLPKTRGHYPDGPFAALVICFCKAAEQPDPGYFENVHVLRAMLETSGQPRGRHLKYLIAHGDAIVLADGRVHLPNWRTFQEEGISTPRVNKHRDVPKQPASSADVTPDATPKERATNTDATRMEPSRPHTGAEKPSLRSGEGSPDGELGAPSGAGSARDDLWTVVGVAEQLTDRPFGYGQGSWTYTTLAEDVRAQGADRVTALMREVRAEVNGTGIDHTQLVREVHHRLYPFTPSTGRRAHRGDAPPQEEIDRAVIR